jgi:hypothetical protein
MLAPLCAYGWSWLANPVRTAPSLPQRVLSAAVLIAALALSLASFRAQEPRRHGAFWDAMDFVNERAEGTSSQQFVASSYDWAIFLRGSSRVREMKLPRPLEEWNELEDAHKSEEMRVLDTLDWLFVHLPALREQPSLVAFLNERFQVAAAFYDQNEQSGLGPLLVLHERDGLGKDLYSLAPFEPRASTRAPLRLARARGQEAPEALAFLRADCEPLPGSGWWWLTYHWRVQSPLTEDYTIEDRLTAPDDRNTWQNNHRPAYGALALRELPAGTEFSEGYLLVPSAVDAEDSARFHPLGGPYRRGDLIPVRLWIEVATEDVEDARLDAWRENDPKPVREELSAHEFWTLDGVRFSNDGLVEVAAFFLPVHPMAAARDDGRPIVE